MEFLLLLFAIAVTIWGLAVWRYCGGTFSVLHPIPVIGLLVLLTGSVISSDFWAMRIGPIPITIDRLLVGLLLLVFFARYLLHIEDRRQVNRLDIAMIWLIAVLTISTVTHDMTLLNNMPPSRLLFFNLMPLAVYGAIRSGVLGTADLKLIAGAIAVLGVYLALTAIAETRGWIGVVFPEYIMTSETTEFLGRGRGPFLNPVSNGMFLIAGFCCALMWWNSVNRFGKAAIVFVSFLLAVGVYCTLTRSVWLGLVVACGWFIWLPASRKDKGFLIVVGTLAIVLLAPTYGDKLVSFKRDKEVSQTQMERSAELRPLFAIVAMNMFEDRPFLGCGFGQYPRAKYPYLKDPRSGKPLSSTRTYMQHNVFLAYLTETGLLGLFSLILVMGMMVRAGLAVWLNTELPFWPRQFGLLLLAILNCYAVNGMFHDVSIIPMGNMLLFFFAGVANNIVSGKWQFDREAAQEPCRSTLTSPLVHVALNGSVCGIDKTELNKTQLDIVKNRYT